MQACFIKDYVTKSHGSASNTLLCMNILLPGMEQFKTSKVAADAASTIPEHARRLDWIKAI